MDESEIDRDEEAHKSLQRARGTAPPEEQPLVAVPQAVQRKIFFRKVKEASDGFIGPTRIGDKLFAVGSTHKSASKGIRITARWSGSDGKDIGVSTSGACPAGQEISVMRLDDENWKKCIFAFPIEKGLVVKVDRLRGTKRLELYHRGYDAERDAMVEADVTVDDRVCTTCKHGPQEHPMYMGQPGPCLTDGCECEAYQYAESEDW